MPTPRVHLIVGDDDYRIGLHVKGLIDQLVPPSERDFGLETFDGCVESCDAAIAVIRQATEAVQTTSFFGNGKTVWVRDVSFLGGQKLADAESLKPSLAYLREVVVDRIPDGHTLILSGTLIAKNTGVAMAVAKQAKLGLAVVTSCDLPTKYSADRDAAAFVAEQAAAFGRRLPPDLCAAVVARAGTNPRTLVTEVEKLLVYAGDQSPTAEDVSAVVTPARGAEAWDLQDAFGNRKPTEALAVLRRLVDMGASPVFLVIQLQTRVNDLLIVRDSTDRRYATGEHGFAWTEGLPPAVAESVADLDKRWNPAAKHSFVQGKLTAQSRNFRRLELRKARQLLMTAHERMVSISARPETLLELAVVEALTATP